jgi:hypothetical protein
MLYPSLYDAVRARAATSARTKPYESYHGLCMLVVLSTQPVVSKSQLGVVVVAVAATAAAKLTAAAATAVVNALRRSLLIYSLLVFARAVVDDDHDDHHHDIRYARIANYCTSP